MDLKAKFMLKNYKELIENRAFNEFDILGFLIFIRSFIYKKFSFNIKVFILKLICKKIKIFYY